MIAQKEIAKALGVSAVTVSRALRNHPDLAEETRERILQKARDLGYGRHKAPRGQSMIRRLGVLLYETELDEKDQFWFSESEIPRRILASLQKEAYKKQIETIFESSRVEEVPLMIRNRTVDAAIIMGRYEPEALSHLRNIPAVSVSSYVANDWLARVVVDNFRGMQIVTEHMISLGHKRILFLGGEKGGSSELHRERERGYSFAMHSHGLDPESIYCSGWRLEQIEADRLIETRLLNATAIACSSDPLAYLALTIFQQAGKSIPQDCSLASFDGNSDSEARGLTTYTPDWALLGRVAVDFVSSSAQNLLGNGMELVVPGRLVVRGTVRAV
jgi:LacI family transcriptional regulator